MSRFLLRKNSTLFCFLYIALCVAIALGGTKKEASKYTDPKYDLSSLWEDFDRILTTLEDRSAEEQYKKRGADITPWMKDTALPSPDNAALLYYQAFLLQPEPNEATIIRMSEVLRGSEPDKTIRIYLGHCLETIHLTELASQMPQCAWGIRYQPGSGFKEYVLGSKVRSLALILATDARTLAADGHHRAALERCLTICRLARHVRNDTIFLHILSNTLDNMAQSTIQHVLGIMPPDADTLTWLQGQLTAVQGAHRSLESVLEVEFRLALQNIHDNPKTIIRWKKELTEKTVEDESAKKEIKEVLSLTDEELIARARESYSKFLNSFLRAMGSDMPYEKKYAELQSLINKLKKSTSDPTTMLGIAPRIMVRYYELQVRHKANFNALRAAIEIFLTAAKTGQLTEKLPENLPKDPYSGQDFDYEITQEGFVLRCREKSIGDNKIWEYEFIIVQ